MSKDSKEKGHMQFFWQKAGKQKSRFNLLLLEYGEHFFEDLGVFYMPPPTAGRTIQQSNALKVQGRLKVCSRSLIFEPNDIRKPIIRYPFKYFTTSFSSFPISQTDAGVLMFEHSGLVVFSCSSLLEMKANGKVGPYKQVDDPRDGGKCVFALLHSEPLALLSKVDVLLHIYNIVQRDGTSADNIRLPYNVSISPGFDVSLLVNFHEVLRLPNPVPVKKVSPMILNPGSLMITNKRIYYQPASINNVDDVVQSIEINKVQRIYCRRYLLRSVGIELLMVDGSSWLFCFDDKVTRDEIFSMINDSPHLSKGAPSLSTITEKWQRKEMTNFEYLMYLNYESGRSVNDLTQYPVFPHILCDFKSENLDLKNPECFRDLSKPIGALNPSRLTHFLDRYESMPPADEANGIPPPFMYGTHYSTPGYVLYYLVRVAPEHMLCLQAGRFDSADRMFTSVKETWDSCYMNPADIKELIPEFFCGTGDFLLNKDDLDLGFRQTGERLGDVELPLWAKNPKDFIKKNVKALECDYVSENLHKWIDLIFGSKQRGEEAVAAHNVFYHLTYEGSVDVEKITNDRERAALEIQIQEFGQTPKQLFFVPHPGRSDKPLKSSGKSLGNPAPVVHTETVFKAPTMPLIGGMKTLGVDNVDSLSDSSGSSRAVSRDPTPVTTLESISSKARDISKESSGSDTGDKDSQQKQVRMSSRGSLIGTAVNSFYNFFGGNAPNTPSNTSSAQVVAEFKTKETSKDVKDVKRTPEKNLQIETLASSGTFTPVGTAASSVSVAAFTPINSKVEPSSGLDFVSPQRTNSLSQSSDVATSRTQSSERPESVARSPKVPNTPGFSPMKKPEAIVTVLPLSPWKSYSNRPITALSVGGYREVGITDSDFSDIPPIQFQCCVSYADGVVKVITVDASIDSVAVKTATYAEKRTFRLNDPVGKVNRDLSLASRAVINPTGNFVLGGTTDGFLHTFSIPSSTVLSKESLHDDCVSCISLDTRERFLVTASSDASIKLWSIRNGMLESSLPLGELFEHESAITALHMVSTSSSAPTDEYVLAAGSSDGMLTCWKYNHARRQAPMLLCNVAVSLQNKKEVMCVHWMGEGSEAGAVGFSRLKLVYATKDGLLGCIDSTGKTISVIRLNYTVNCLTVVRTKGVTSTHIPFIIVGGCSDKSLRVWVLTQSQIIERFCCNTTQQEVVNGEISALPLEISTIWSSTMNVKELDDGEGVNISGIVMTGCYEGSLTSWFLRVLIC